LAIELGMSNQYSKDLSVNVKRGNKTKIKNGGWCSVAPHGYINNIVEKTVEIDTERFNLVRKMWDLALTGRYSIKQICDIANNDWGFKTIRKRKIGGSPIAVGTLSKVFKNPFYYGRVKNSENENSGNHQRMITYMEFQKVQRNFEKSGRKALTSCSFNYTGMIFCGECRCMITAESKVKYKCPKCKKRQTAKHPKVCSCGYSLNLLEIPKTKFYTYYHCSKSKQKCSQKSIRK
jgi:hypothetical protein